MKKIKIIALSCLMISLFSCHRSNRQDTNSSTSFKNDFESSDVWTNRQTIIECPAHSGKFACKLDSNIEFGVGFAEMAAKIGTKTPTEVSIKIWVNIPDLTANSTLVFHAIKTDGTNAFWFGVQLNKMVKKANEWTEVDYKYKFPTELKGDEKVMIYTWNDGKKVWYADDLSVSFN